MHFQSFTVSYYIILHYLCFGIYFFSTIFKCFTILHLFVNCTLYIVVTVKQMSGDCKVTPSRQDLEHLSTFLTLSLTSERRL